MESPNEPVGFTPWKIVAMQNEELGARVGVLENLLEKLLVFMSEHPTAELSYHRPDADDATYRVSITHDGVEFQSVNGKSYVNCAAAAVSAALELALGSTYRQRAELEADAARHRALSHAREPDVARGALG